MSDWRDVPMPRLVAQRPRDPRGFPIPFLVGPPPGGKLDFRVVNPKHKLICAKEDRCMVCGEMLEYWKVFIGGPMCVDLRFFGDPPLHPACADYAMKVCPMLVTDLQYADLDYYLGRIREDGGTIDPYASRNKPKYAVTYRARSYKWERDGDSIFFRPAAAANVTYYRHGEPLPGDPEDLAEVVAKAKAAVGITP